VVRKGEHGEDGYSGFTMRHPVTGAAVPTPLADRLRAAGVQRLVVLGLATDYCVRATALEGRELGWPVTVPWAAVRAVDLQPGDGERTREELLAAGVEVV
jgi:nicotinamidase/pyrazinamidase